MQEENTKRRTLHYAVITGLILLILTFICTYTININQKAVSSTLGKITLIDKSGLHFKLPSPLQKIYYLDTRNQIFEGKLIETRLENNNLLVKIFARWQIAKGKEILFYRKVGTLFEANNQLSSIIQSTQKQVFQNYKWEQLFNRENNSKINEIEQQILHEAKQKANLYGVDINFVGISQINLTQKDSSSVLKRMSAEQDRIANEIKIQGESKVNRIKTKAKTFKQNTLAKAKREAFALRNEAVIDSVKLYTTEKNLNNDFAIFLRKLDALEVILKRNPTLILDSNTSPFSLLK